MLETVIDHTVTCYEGNTTKVFEWGYGCGECPACKLRAKGWEQYVGVKDMTA